MTIVNLNLESLEVTKVQTKVGKFNVHAVPLANSQSTYGDGILYRSASRHDRSDAQRNILNRQYVDMYIVHARKVELRAPIVETKVVELAKLQYMVFVDHLLRLDGRLSPFTVYPCNSRRIGITIN